MTDADPLPARVHEYVADGNHDATPDKVLQKCDLSKSCRLQVEHFLAITRLSMFKDREDNDTSDLRWDRMEWADVANWDV